MRRVLLFFVFIGLFFSSCSLSIQKRKYLSGYAFSIKKGNYPSNNFQQKLNEIEKAEIKFIHKTISIKESQLKSNCIPTKTSKTLMSFLESKENSKKNFVRKSNSLKKTKQTEEEKKARKVQFKKSLKKIGIVAAISLFTLLVSALVLSFIALSFFEGLFFISLLALVICFLMLITTLLRRIFFRSTFKKSSLIAFIFVVAFILGSILVYLNLFEN